MIVTATDELWEAGWAAGMDWSELCFNGWVAQDGTVEAAPVICEPRWQYLLSDVRHPEPEGAR